MSSIEESPIYEDIKNVFQRTDDVSTDYEYTLEFITPDGVVTTDKVLSYSILRDYEHHHADEHTMEVGIKLGSYMKDVYPYRNNLKATVKRTKLNKGENENRADKKSKAITYMAILMEYEDPVKVNAGKATQDKATADNTAIHHVQMQLTSPILATTRLWEQAGIFRDCKIKDVLLAILNGSDGRGVDIVEPDNKTTYDAIIIPKGVSVVGLVDYIQKEYGIYNESAGQYMQDDIWFVYPLYNIKRFAKAKRTLTVANIPKNLLQGVETTYNVLGKALFIIATSEVQHIDTSNIDQLNTGSGSRYVDADRILNGFVVNKGGKTYLDVKENIVTLASTKRDDGLLIQKYSKRGISANHLDERSQLASKLGAVMTFKWENSYEGQISQNPDSNNKTQGEGLIRPCMPVRFLYAEMVDGVNVARQLDGVVLKVMHHTERAGQKMSDIVYKSNSLVSLFLVPHATHESSGTHK